MSKSNTLPLNQITDAAIKVLTKDVRAIFAYLYGSTLSGSQGNDVDIAVFADSEVDRHLLSADLKIDLHRETGIPPDDFDIQVINGILETGDIFALLYLKNVLEQGIVLVDKDFEARSDFIERYGLKFRECEGLMQEVLA
jgi:predicted nucleotidyltransferase